MNKRHKLDRVQRRVQSKITKNVKHHYPGQGIDQVQLKFTKNVRRTGGVLDQLPGEKDWTKY